VYHNVSMVGEWPCVAGVLDMTGRIALLAPPARVMRLLHERLTPRAQVYTPHTSLSSANQIKINEASVCFRYQGWFGMLSSYPLLLP
jgi:hypothetical protein